ncbi:hypothetical protein RHS01_11059 [Rhizoctonia solani]|uniref:CCHC-type domain-containing protein n=1 Tax=Rhizoctonia solani TaxID=456999 RepID=A0A8H7LWP0_9AGAM|nr:hypothetical protein RHS01_11059 [Rhizoctonia solani]
MEPEPSLAALLEAVTALTATVGSLQDQIRSQGQQLTELKAICKETADLLGNKDQGTQAQPSTSVGPVTPPTHTGEKRTLQERLGLDSRPLSAHQEERALIQKKRKNPGESPKGSLATRLNGASAPSPHLTQGPAGRKATQWLDRMLLWVALHQDQFDEEEQMVVWILYHMTDKAADWALPIIGTIIKGKVYARPSLEGQGTPVHKDNIPDNDLEAIFAALVKIDNTCRENKENRPKKAPAKSPATVVTSTTTTQRVCLSKDSNYVTPEERDRRCASGLCVKCGQKGHGIKQCPNGWKATIKEVAKVAEEELGKD